MSQKVLVVLTSHNTLGDTGKETGFYLSEVSHPVAVFDRAGFSVDYVSPKGGEAPMIGVDREDDINANFLDDADKMAQVKNTLSPAQVDPADYAAIFYAGGHGTMWDFPNAEDLGAIAASIYEKGGVVGAVCHGPAGLVPIRLSTGEALVAGKEVAGFTNQEEEAVGLSEVVPFLLANRLTELGATHTQSDNFEPHVVKCDRLVTGQNPASAKGVGEAIVGLLADE
ncbi:MAG: type 1 glutamine amidotransferase domain-containing protein [Phormidesmis sp.]